MKNIYLLIAASAMSIAAYAQPTLYNDSGRAGSKFNIYLLGSVNIANAANMGANVTWDLSASTTTLVGDAEYMNMASTPYASRFPDANFAIKVTTLGVTRYNVFRRSDTLLEELGNSMGTSDSAAFTNPRTVLVFPFTYSLSDTDTYQKGSQASATIIHTYDGYGTFTSSTSTHNNIVREVGNDDGDTTITWWNPANLAPVLQADSKGFIQWVQTASAGVASVNNNTLFDMYPNPATNTLHIFNKELLNRVDIINMSGQLQFSTTQSVIDISALVPGIYIVRATSDKGIAIQEFVKQ